MSGVFRHLSLWMLATAFSLATVLLAAGPLRALRLGSPFWVYWPGCAAVSACIWMMQMPAAAFAFAGVALVVGLFTEIEGWGANRGASALGAVITLVASVGVIFGAWCRTIKASPISWLMGAVEPMMAKVKETYPSLDLNAEMLVSQLPSALVLGCLVALAIAILSENTWLRLIEAPLRSRTGLTNFRLWDAAIYVLMVALLAAFTRHGIKPVSIAGTNILNVIVMLYFFQGMAVVFKAFDFFGVGVFWRTVLGFVLTFQLFFLVAVVGVADYWLEFRNRLTRRPVGPKTNAKTEL